MDDDDENEHQSWKLVACRQPERIQKRKKDTKEKRITTAQARKGQIEETKVQHRVLLAGAVELE